MTQDTGAPASPSGSRASTEPSCTVSALTGIDPSREMPSYIAETVRKMGKVDWGAVGPKSDEEHLEDFRDSLAITREHHGTRGPQHLHGLYLTGTDTVLCHTGTSPNSARNAQALADVWNWLVDAAIATEAGTAETTKIGSVHEGAGPKDIAQGTLP